MPRAGCVCWARCTQKISCLAALRLCLSHMAQPGAVSIRATEAALLNQFLYRDQLLAGLENSTTWV